ncbi:MAG: hypothetical protein ABI431_06950 [Candidatus Tumulicola sp.]
MATFSKETLSKFADACASIPLRPLDRAFERAGIRPGKTDDDSGGARRTQFRRYLAGVDRNDERQLQQLGDALGALIDEVADSKKAFLIGSAERDGFSLTDGTFRVAVTDASSFALTSLDDAAAIDDRIRRLRVLAGELPGDAVAGSRQLVESAGRIAGDGIGGKNKTAAVVRVGLRNLAQLIDSLDDLADAKLTAAQARLAVDAAAALVWFVADRT